MQSGSLYLGEFIFGETGVTVRAASRLRVNGRTFTCKPGLKAFFREYHGHAGVQVSSAITGFTGQDRAGQHAIFPFLPKSSEGQGWPSCREM